MSSKKFFFVAAFLLGSLSTYAQLVVDGKNVNDDKKVQYIQLSYYTDKKTLLPVWLLDYGIKNLQEVSLTPKIEINGDTLEAISPVSVLNKLYDAGWEYLGDHIYTENLQLPLHTYTLRRKHH